MRRVLAAVALSCIAAMPLRAGETYDLMFRPGTLTQADGTVAFDALTYDGMARTGADATAFRITAESATDGTTALIRTQTDQTHRVGSFPTSVGNPVIMYFMEETLRDVARATGGSPFYLRNRIKDALLGSAEITPATARVGGADIPARQVTIRPFADIPEHDRMGPFGDLALSVIVADAIPGWYGRLEARTPADDAAAEDTRADNTGAAETGAYAYTLTLSDAAETAQ